MVITYVQEHIVDQTNGEENTLIHLSAPALSRAEVDGFCICFDASNDCQAGESCSLERHRSSGRRIVAND